jgi:hypothetical protein
MSSQTTGGAKATGGFKGSGGDGPAGQGGASGAGAGGSAAGGSGDALDASVVSTDASSPDASDGAAGRNPPCDATHLDCDGDPSNGCEVDAQNDATNCGACKHACAMTNAGSTSCVKGACAPVCSSGFGDCAHPTATPDDGCETDLGAANNCGACGHDCGGANCNLSLKCDPLTFSNSGGEFVTADASYVYWASGDSVLRAPIRGGLSTPILTNTGSVFTGVAVDDAFVYACDTGSNHAIRRQALSTPGAGSVVSDNGDQPAYDPCPLIVDSVNVYWTDYGTRAVFKKPKDGTGVREALTRVFSESSFSLAVDATNIYFGSRPGFAPIDVWDSGPITTGYASAGSVSYIAIDDRYAYYGTDKGLARMLKNNTGTLALLYQALVPDGPLAIDDNYLYFGDRYGTSGIHKIPKTGGSPIQVAADPYNTTLFVSGKSLYWADFGTGNSDAFVRKLAL